MNLTAAELRWLLEAFPGASIESSTVDSRQSIPRKEPPPMTDTLFDLPDEAKEDPQLSDFNGHLMLIRPTTTKTVDTSFGSADVTVADVVVVKNDGKLISLPQTFVFWKGVNDQLSRAIGTGRWVAGILRQGAGKNAKAWSLGAPTAVEQSRLSDVMNSAEFRGIIHETADEPF